MAGDGQVTLGESVIKHKPRKSARLYQEKILAGLPDPPQTHSRSLAVSNPSWSSIMATSAAPPWNWPKTGAPTNIFAISKRCCWFPIKRLPFC